VPHHDLRVTKGHAFHLDEVLIPVEFLVNHRSIMWDDHAREVALYHIELATHDVVYANGAPAESYRDDGNRWLFGNANTGWGLPPKQPYAPVLSGGPIVDAVRRRRREGQRPSVPLTDDPALHLLVDGRRIDADRRSDLCYKFCLIAKPTAVRVVSLANAPQELGLARDPRPLGVALRQIVVTQGKRTQVIGAEDNRLTKGFHEFEVDDGIRWTDGDACARRLVRGLHRMELALHLGCRTTYAAGHPVSRAA
jgi:hypothetical protein